MLKHHSKMRDCKIVMTTPENLSPGQELVFKSLSSMHWVLNLENWMFFNPNERDPDMSIFHITIKDHEFF